MISADHLLATVLAPKPVRESLKAMFPVGIRAISGFLFFNGKEGRSFQASTSKAFSFVAEQSIDCARVFSRSRTEYGISRTTCGATTAGFRDSPDPHRGPADPSRDFAAFTDDIRESAPPDDPLSLLTDHFRDFHTSISRTKSGNRPQPWLAHGRNPGFIPRSSLAHGPDSGFLGP